MNSKGTDIWCHICDALDNHTKIYETLTYVQLKEN
jgi:hypothetical protein